MDEMAYNDQINTSNSDEQISQDQPGQNSILDRVLESKKVSNSALEPEEVIQNLINQKLDIREQAVLKQRHGLDEDKVTLEQIGKKLGVTRERVRQIAKQALKKLADAKGDYETLNALDLRLKELFEASGGLREEKSLLKDFFGSASHKQAPYLIFFLENLSEYINESGFKKPSWQLSGAPAHLHKDLENLVLNYLQSLSEPQEVEKIHEHLQTTPEFNNWQEQFRSAWPGRDEHVWEAIINAYLELSDKLAINPFDEWGLATSSLVKPKRMGDKIYLVLSKQREPLHFNDITDMINKYNFDKRKAYGPTVHNELILDDRFVLVGRGIYALKEWGYKEGTVTEVLERILASATEPVSREELIDAVLKERLVKEGTIMLALTDKDKFSRTDDGRYLLAISQ